MSNVATMPVAPAVSSPKPLSTRTRELCAKFRQLQFVDTGMTREDVEKVVADLRAMTADAEALEQNPLSTTALPINPGVCPAYELLAGAEKILFDVKRELVDRLQFPEADPQARLQGRLGDATAQIMRAQDHIRENAGELRS